MVHTDNQIVNKRVYRENFFVDAKFFLRFEPNALPL